VKRYREQLDSAFHPLTDSRLFRPLLYSPWFTRFVIEQAQQTRSRAPSGCAKIAFHDRTVALDRTLGVRGGEHE
jgi:hypothetical protein